MELINKEDAVALIKEEIDKIRTHNLVDGTARINLRLAKNIIEDMPTIDIVRCKECKKCYKDTDALTKQTVLICQKHKYEFDWEKVEADDFCSYGERMQVMYYPQVDGITPSVIGNSSEKPNNSKERSRE